jgi:uncharacterized protein YndB with AHSA1/START domain
MDEPIIIEQQFEASLNEVWEAITLPEKMKQWYFANITAFEPRVGFETGFLVQSEEREFPHHWKITEVIPEKKIAYIWTFKGYPGVSKVSFDLFEQQEGTRLGVTATVIEPFPADIPEFKRESGVAGWTYFIKERLKSFLEEQKK